MSTAVTPVKSTTTHAWLGCKSAAPPNWCHGSKATPRTTTQLRVTMPRQPKGIQHGTPGGHRTHRSRGEESCGPCTAAARAQNTRYNERKNARRRIERASV